jgi:hypothetical protein
MKRDQKFHYGLFAVRKFLPMFRESLYNVKRTSKNRDRNKVMHSIRNPNLDRNVLAEKFPNVTSTNC